MNYLVMNKEIKRRLDKWVSENYEKVRKEIATNIAYGKMGDYADDLYHHILSDLYKVKDEQLKDMLDNDRVIGWILRSSSLQIRSGSSPFYHKFRKHKMGARSGIIDSNSGNTYDEGYYMPDGENEELMDCFDRAHSQLHWYLQTIFNQKFKEGKTLQEIYEYYNITKTHLVKDLNKAINEIRDICKDAV